MEKLLELLADSNSSIIDAWAIFITVNTATVGWVLSKKVAFSKHHVWIAAVAYAAFTFSIYEIIDARYSYRNAVLLDLQSLVSNKNDNDTIVNSGTDPVSLKGNEINHSNMRKYIIEQSTDYKIEVYLWLILSWFIICLLFYFDSRGQFHPKESVQKNSV